MSKNNAFIITLAYPETIVSHSEEWYSKFLRFLYVGNRRHVKAGHGALVLIDKTTGIIEYHDFGRYVTPVEKGRVRGRQTDFELAFPIVAAIENNTIKNLNEILEFLATHPKLTHGKGHLYASVCNAVNYDLARAYITKMQNRDLIRYAVFIKEASNCSRFVTDTLIASISNSAIKKKLQYSKWFTPSTLGNVVIADTECYVYKVSEEGKINKFNSTVIRENRRFFLDNLKEYNPSLIGTIEPKHNDVKVEHAQWIGGIGSGAWFEVYDLKKDLEYRYRRISSYGNVDCDGIYIIDKEGFDITLDYQFVHYSNCLFFHIEQHSIEYRFDFVRNYED